MGKILKSLVISMIIVCSMTVSIFATSAEDIRQELLAVGVPSSYIGSLIEYLQKNTISDTDHEKIVAYIDEARAILGNVEHVGELSDSEQLTIKNLAVKAGNTIGLEVSFGKEDGITTLIVKDANDATVLKMATLDAIESFESYHPVMHVEIIAKLADYLESSGNVIEENDGSKNDSIVNGSTGSNSIENDNIGNGSTGSVEFEAIGGELTQTATPYASIMLVGLGMITVGTVLVKKQFA